MRLLQRRARLEVEAPDRLSGLAEGTVFTLDRGRRYLVGRGADATLRVANPAISRNHATLHFQGGRWRLTDLGTANGTRVGGVRIDRWALTDGDLVEIGDLKLRFLEQTREGWHCPALAEAIGLAPDDDSPWQVYADWLLEQGVSLGPREMGDTAALERLALEMGPMALRRLTFRYGLLEAVQVRLSQEVCLEGLLVSLSELPVATALCRLTIALSEDVLVLSLPEQIAQVEEILGRIGPLAWQAVEIHGPGGALSRVDGSLKRPR